MKAIDQSSIRRQNMRKILDLLTQQSPITRQSLADATGLSLMTVTNLIDQLKKQNVLEFLPVERVPDRRASGRKAENISLSGSLHAWLILDLSGREFRYTLLGFNLAIISQKSGSSEGDYQQQLESFLLETKADLAQLLDQRQLLGVSVVTPGPYEISSDTVYNQRLPQLNRIRIKETLRKNLGEFEYYVDEDVKFAVRSFSHLIEQEHCELLYYLFIGEGVGGAAVHNGDMLRGLNATAGDPGQLTAPNGATYESLLSLSAFAASLHCSAGTPDQLLAQLQEREQADPKTYLQALEKAADTLCAMLSGVLWLLDPSHLVIDCRYALSFQEQFLAMITQRLTALLSPAGRRIPVVDPVPQCTSSVANGAIQVLQREWLERIIA